MHAAIDKYVDENLLAGACAVVLKDNRIVDYRTWGYADTQRAEAIREDTIYRIYSNTKIITSTAAMCLFEDGKFDLDDPIEKYLPELSGLKVLKAGSDDPSETENLKSIPTVRQLVSHHAGFSYGVFAESPVDQNYLEAGVTDPSGTLEEMISKLSNIPLAYQPGSRWQYKPNSFHDSRLFL